jgi:cytochrome c-type biogenesis protein CcmF
LLALWIVDDHVNIRERVSHLVGNSLTSCLAALPRAYWGMVLAHCGIAIFIVGVTMVKGFEVEQDRRMNVGETSTIGGYTFRFDGVREIKGPNYMAARGVSRE